MTVSWNLYTPDVRFETIIWSSKLDFYKAWNIKTHRRRITNSSGVFFFSKFPQNWTLSRTVARSSSNRSLFTHLNDSIRVSGEHLPVVGCNLMVIFALYAVQHHCVLRLDHPVRASIGHRWTVRFIWRETVVSVYMACRQELRQLLYRYFCIANYRSNTVRTPEETET